nr:AP2 domain-containing protein [Sporosarcina sp. E16_3]
MGAGKGQIVDHRDGNKLNNTRANLRFATVTENNRNEGPTVRNTTGYKGVTRRNGRFAATIRNNGVGERLGNYDTAREAAKAYNIKAEEYFGKFAWLNDVDHEGFEIRKLPKQSSMYRGVHYVEVRGKWVASIWNNSIKKKIVIGSYDTEDGAALAYNAYAKELKGDKAHVNIVQKETTI